MGIYEWEEEGISGHLSLWYSVIEIIEMARRRSRRSEYNGPESLGEIGALFIVGGAAYMAWQFHADRAIFWRLLFWVIGAVIVSVVATFIILDRVMAAKRKRLEKLVQRVRTAGMEQEILNFIVRFDGEKGVKEERRAFGMKSFLRQRMNLFIEALNNKGLNIDADEFCTLLEHYIHEDELKLTAASVVAVQGKLDTLTGSDFERLLQRLYTARGYQVQAMGGVGDQGGDLIANKPGERILIQAKRYKGSVGNDAVQQAAAARAHYDCATAVVVTSGHFTSEAFALAKTNTVMLIGRKELQQYLLDVLKESWG